MHVRSLQRNSEGLYHVICFISGYCSDIQNFFIVLFVVLHGSWIPNSKLPDNQDISVVIKQGAKIIGPKFLLIHFSILSIMREKI